jgi:hypothetical protein
MSGLEEPLLADQAKKSRTAPTMAVTSRQLDPEEAETHNVAQLDILSSRNSGRRLSYTDQQFEQMHHLLANPGDDDDTANTGAGGSSSALRTAAATTAPSFKTVARRVMLMQKLQQHKSQKAPSSPRRHRRHYYQQTNNNTLYSPRPGHHRKNKSSAAELLDQIMDNPEETSEEPYEQQEAHHHTTIFQSAGLAVSSTSDTESEPFIEDEAEDEDDSHPGDTLPMVVEPPTYGSISSEKVTPKPPSPPAKSWTKHPFWKHLKNRCFSSRCDVSTVATQLCQVILDSYFVKLAMPLFVAAVALYYGCGNPPWSFIPGRQHSAWLLNFLGRQVVTLELARMTQWLVLDCILLGSRSVAILVGPFVTMTAVQSRGWPFVVACWACWDLLILRGDSDFQAHWFYWTGWRLYTVAISGQYILTSDLYWRFLLSMIAAGMVTTAKRMFLTVRFGRRMLGKLFIFVFMI